jgi:PhoPQ-activated pathogenicity-related protein
MKRIDFLECAVGRLVPIGVGLVVVAGPCLAREPALAGRTQRGERTALDRYVAAADPSYGYERVHSFVTEGCTVDVLRLTSQTWLTEAEVDRPVWQHWLSIVRPPEVAHETGFLFISGGSSDRPVPDKVDASAVMMAAATKSVAAVLSNVPAQPLVFAGETTKRTEDSLVAYTWDKFLRTGDEKWPARLPMTKAAVRAMDAVTSYCAGEQGGKTKVETFFVMGGSKRGWTTWTTAAVDERVVAIAPAVIDTLNVEPSLRGHFEAYGFFAPSLHDYTEQRIVDWSGTPQMKRLQRIEDPFEYRERLTLPKFIVNAAGDQYFPTDSARHYFDALPGVKYIRAVPNADHGLKGTDAWSSLLAFYDAVLRGAPFPEFSWTHEGEDAVRVTAKTAPSAVKLWQATNPAARDFRLESLGKAWTSTDLTRDSDGSWVGRVARPEKGWTAYFVELTFPGPSSAPFIFTNVPRVFPDVMPHRWVERKPPEAEKAAGP